MSLLRSLKQRAKYYLRRGGFEADSKIDMVAEFRTFCAKIESPRVLELGTRQGYAGVSTRRDDWIPHASEYIGTDIELGADVDQIADVHRLSKMLGEESFDVIISCSSFEHFKYPFLAAHEIMKTLKVGGLLFIQTHQTFPLHAAPYDYFRFSKAALAALFGTQMGFNVIRTDHEFPARIRSRSYRDAYYMPAYLNSRLLGEKTVKTPDEFVYEYDVKIDGSE